MNNRNSILFVTHKLNVGGAAKMMKYAADVARESFDIVKMLAINDESREFGISENIRVITMGIKPKPRVLWQIKAALKLRKQLKKDDSLYVCTFVTQVAFITKIASLGLNKIIISAERGDPYTMTFLWKKMAKWLYKNSHFSLFQLPNARDFYGVDHSKSFVIPNPILMKENVQPNYGVRNKTIVSAGRFVPEKLFEVLIEAFYLVSKKHPDYKLIIYGNGPLLTKYKEITRKYEISELVEFPGYIQNFESIVRNEGIFVLSSLFEGIPNTLIEAMSVGTPCVATNCTPGGPAMLIQDGVNGILVPVKDVDAMYIAINNLIENDELREMISRNSNSVQELLRENKIRRMWLDAFDTIKKYIY